MIFDLDLVLQPHQSRSRRSTGGMGNLLRVLYNRGDDSPTRVDIFVDFESKQPVFHLKWPHKSLHLI